MNSPLPRPQVDLSTDWLFPLPSITELDNGLSIWAYDLPGQYVITAELVLDVSLVDEPEGQEGLARLAVVCCDEGSVAHPGDALARRIEDIGAAFEGHAGWWATHCGLEVAASHASAAIDLLDEIVRTPAYADSDVARHRALRLTQIDQQSANSSALARTGLAQLNWALGSRQFLAAGGTRDSVSTITAEQVRAFHDRWWRPDGATLVLAGTLPEGLVEHAAEVLGAWPATGQRSGAAAPVPLTEPGPVRVIDRPGAVAADLRAGLVVPGRTWAGWAPLQVAAGAVGGLFGSRLNMELRERQGLTYGVQAGLASGRFNGSFTIQSSFRTEVAARALHEITELLDLTDNPLTAAETEDTIRFLMGIAPLRYDTADAIAAQAGMLAAHRAGPDWVNELNRRRAATDPAEATAAFEETVGRAAREGCLHAVLCGDASRLVPALEDEGLRAEVLEPQL